jgi:deoxyribonuclease-4
MSLIGIHINDNIDGLENETTIVRSGGGNLVQLFVNTTTKSQHKYNNYKKFLERNFLKCVVHASYTINCSQTWNKYSWWITQFILEIETAHKIGAIGIVVHLGKQLSLSSEEALNNMYTSLLHVHFKTKEYQDVKIFIETSSGQGSEMCYKLEDLAHFYRKILTHRNEKIKNRFGICVDTCHIFSAGYDIRNENTLKQYLDKFNELIGLEQIKLIHLNDSKNELGSRVDRHENLGTGHIGLKPLIKFAQHFSHIPIILETPTIHILNDLKILSKCIKKLNV